MRAIAPIPRELHALSPEIREITATLLLSAELKSFYSLGILDLRRLPSRGRFLIDTLERFSALTAQTLPSPLPDGMTLRPAQGTPILLYRAALHPHRRNWTIAHELGHLFLSHTEPSARTERQADAFAAALLMPPCVIGAWEEWKGTRMSEAEMLASFAVSRLAVRRARVEMDARPLKGISRAEEMLVKRLLGEAVSGRSPRNGEAYPF